MADVNWRHGSLVTPPTPEPPTSVGDDPAIGALLDEAENIINAVGPEVRAEVDAAEQEARRQRDTRRKWWPFGKR